MTQWWEWHPITFAIFYCLKASHRSCPHSRREDYTKVWTPGVGDHGGGHTKSLSSQSFQRKHVHSNQNPRQDGMSTLHEGTNATGRSRGLPTRHSRPKRARWPDTLHWAAHWKVNCPGDSSPAKWVHVVWGSFQLQYPMMTPGPLQVLNKHLSTEEGMQE